MSSLKQIIVIRKDLNMSAGKLATQVAHASLDSYIYCKDLYPKITDEWLENSYTKVVLYVKSEKDLLSLSNKLDLTDIPHSLIQDEGRTEFNEPTYTSLGIGPFNNAKIDEFTSKLRIYNGEIVTESRTCGNCKIMDCEILHALANTGTIRLVDFGCNRWINIKDKN